MPDRQLYGHALVYICGRPGHSIGHSKEHVQQFPFMLFVCKCLSEGICALMHYDNVLLFSVLHLAVQHKRQQRVKDICALIKKIPPANPPLIDVKACYGKVNGL